MKHESFFNHSLPWAKERGSEVPEGRGGLQPSLDGLGRAAMGWRTHLHPTTAPLHPLSVSWVEGAGALELQRPCTEKGVVGQGDRGLGAQAGSISAWHVAPAPSRGAGGQALVFCVKGVEQKP